MSDPSRHTEALSWEPLKQSYWNASFEALAQGEPLPVDPYLVWAEATGFDMLAPGHGGKGPLSVLVQLKVAAQAAGIAQVDELAQVGELARVDELARVVGTAGTISTLWRSPLPKASQPTVPFCVLKFTSFASLVATIEKADFRGLVERLIVGEPIAAKADPSVTGGQVPKGGGRSGTAALLGIVDDGCAFAHQALRDEHGRTFVRALWDQDDQTPAFRTWLGGPDWDWPARHGDARRNTADAKDPADDLRKLRDYRPAQEPDYGQVVWSHHLAFLMSRHARPPAPRSSSPAMPAGPVDEQACYLAAEYPSALRAVSHGMHVLGLASGLVPAGGLGERPGTDRLRHRESPAQMPDIAFVQIPKAGIADASGAWLPTRLLDAVRFILQCATDETDRAVINISYGPQCGPLDGSSPLEEALAALVRAYGAPFDDLSPPSAADAGSSAGGAPLPGIGAPLRMSLDIVLPAGKAHRARSRARLTLAQGQHGDLGLRVQPDNPRPTFVECWLSPDPAVEVEVEVAVDIPGQPPSRYLSADGAWCPDTMGTGKGDPRNCTVVFAKRVSRGRHGAMLLLAIGPTASAEGAPAGHWTLRFRNAHAGPVTIDAFVGRGDANHGAHARERQACLIDPAYDPDRYLRAADVDGRSAVVRRQGTLSGIASGGAVQVVGGYRMDDDAPAIYTSSGPARTGGAIVNWSAPSDQGALRQGIVGLSNRSGGTARFVGTSAAAPQIAAYILQRRDRQQAPWPPGWEPNAHAVERLSTRRLKASRLP